MQHRGHRCTDLPSCRSQGVGLKLAGGPMAISFGGCAAALRATVSHKMFRVDEWRSKLRLYFNPACATYEERLEDCILVVCWRQMFESSGVFARVPNCTIAHLTGVVKRPRGNTAVRMMYYTGFMP